MHKASLQLLQQPLCIWQASQHARHNAAPAAVLHCKSLPALRCYCCSLLLYRRLLRAVMLEQQVQQLAHPSTDSEALWQQAQQSL
jgi:hypothetical protein